LTEEKIERRKGGIISCSILWRNAERIKWYLLGGLKVSRGMQIAAVFSRGKNGVTMIYRNTKRSLFLLSLLGLLFVGRPSLAIDDGTLVDECTYMGCDGWNCITWGRGDDQRFCWCTFCEDYSAAGSVYQVGQDQYLCGAVPNRNGLTQKCVSFPVQVKSMDLNNTRIEGSDKAAFDEIIRLKGLNSNLKDQTIAPTGVTTPIQKPKTLIQKSTTLTK
jgi:hypothetical protein